MGNITSVTIARHPSGGDSPNRHPELVNCSVDIVPWRDVATVEMGASWDHEYQIKSSIQSSISRGSITWQISGYECGTKFLTCNTWLTIKPFNNKKWINPSYPWKKNITTRDYRISPLAFPTKWLKSPNPAALMACTWRKTQRSSKLPSLLPLQKRTFNKPASKLYIVSPGYEEGMKPAADFKITHGFIVFDTKQKVKLKTNGPNPSTKN